MKRIVLVIGVMAKGYMSSVFRPVSISLQGQHAKSVKASTSGYLTSPKKVEFQSPL